MSEQKHSGFGARLRQLREAAGLTQEGLAEQAGMHRFGIAKLERGEREPAWATVQSLAKALGVNCLAFQDDGETVHPAEPARTRGRPKKTDTAATGQPDAEPRDRPRKDAPAATKKPAAKKGKKRKG